MERLLKHVRKQGEIRFRLVEGSIRENFNMRKGLGKCRKKRRENMKRMESKRLGGL